MSAVERGPSLLKKVPMKKAGLKIKNQKAGLLCTQLTIFSQEEKIR